jgi:uncharacterized membrane protein YeaQ/YmgE (transglycosylase-associated protein family)
MGIISWIVVGLIAGALAKLVLPGDDPGGIIVTAIIGMVGAILHAGPDRYAIGTLSHHYQCG